MKAHKPPADRSIEQQIKRLLLTILPVMGGMILALIITLFTINSRYNAALMSANTAAAFNQEFKMQLDAGMYNHVIQPRSPSSVDELPMAILDDAEGVLTRLEEITTLPDNLWRIRSMLDMCATLRGYMVQIALEPSYDERMLLLERNIRGETGLTMLIETYMHDYIGDEVRELARIQGVLRTQVTVLSIVIVTGSLLLTALMLTYALKVTRRITGPISALSRKAQRFASTGATDSPISPAEELILDPIDTHITELRTLDAGFDEMAQRVHGLMQRQMEAQRSLHRAELELLQAQINPHFLYNTLDSIAILAEDERAEDVIHMVTSLSTFFRNSLSRGEDVISLSAECAQVRSYLEIQQIRYSDILGYDICVPETLLDCRVPKLILQPLVENALYHGVKNRRGKGCITVTAEAAGNDLLLRVTDNGAGMDEKQVRELQSGLYEDKHTGLGLVNVHKRIRLYCGAEYGLSFESAPGQGTTVTARLPQTRLPAMQGAKEDDTP